MSPSARALRRPTACTVTPAGDSNCAAALMTASQRVAAANTEG